MRAISSNRRLRQSHESLVKIALIWLPASPIRLTRERLPVQFFRSDRCIFIGRILQLHNAERNTIHEDKDIRPPIVLVFDDRELIDGKPVIRVRVIKINNFDRAIGQTRTLTLRFATPSSSGRGRG